MENVQSSFATARRRLARRLAASVGIAGVLIWHLRLKGVKPDAALPSEFEP